MSRIVSAVGISTPAIPQPFRKLARRAVQRDDSRALGAKYGLACRKQQRNRQQDCAGAVEYRCADCAEACHVIAFGVSQPLLADRVNELVEGWPIENAALGSRREAGREFRVDYRADYIVREKCRKQPTRTGSDDRHGSPYPG